MEILSTGEKIKRSRVYKGYTLKELCSDKISVSKMSCIENDKIGAEDWVLDFVAKELDMQPDYLKKDIKQQILSNIEKAKGLNDLKKYEDALEYNLKYAEEFGYSEVAFNLIHLLFNHYIVTGELEKVQLVISKYYELWNKCCTSENELLYYMDVARYFYATAEYIQAAGYFRNVRMASKKCNDYNTLARATYNEAACYLMLQNYERAYEVAVRLGELMDFLELDLKKAEAYHMLAMLSLRRDEEKFSNYEEKAYKLYGANLDYKAKAMHNFASVMLDVSRKNQGASYIEKALSCYPNDNLAERVNFMLECIFDLVDHGLLDKAKDKCEEALDLAIEIDNIKYIEKAYYFKSRILEGEGDYLKAEMYMNLSLDTLLKCGNTSDIYKRYLLVGDMYYRMNNVTESLKYFNFAIQLEKKM
jgi:tetratricopeptide (TPR) repeat protein